MTSLIRWVPPIHEQCVNAMGGTHEGWHPCGSGGKTTVAFDLGTGGFDDLHGLAVPPSGGIYVAGSVDVALNVVVFGVAKVIGSVVFGDGFESGSAAAWSRTVPDKCQDRRF